jgi:hypothetical protein
LSRRITAKRGQTWSFEVYLAIAIFMLTIIFFLSLVSVNVLEPKFPKVASDTDKKIFSIALFSDGEVTEEELLYLTSFNCTALKEKLRFNYDWCIYFEDEDGNAVNISVISGETSYAFGCAGVNISGRSCNFSNI